MLHMALNIKLSKMMKFLCVIVLLVGTSTGFAADPLKDQENPPLTIVKSHKNYGFGGATFLKQEEELIKDRPLTLWGVGLFSSAELVGAVIRTLTASGVGLFSSADLVGAVIRTLTASNWSHCGLILMDEKDQTRFCFESTGAASQIFQGIVPQVQISLWDDTAKNYNGSVAERQFIFKDQQPESADIVQYVRKYLGTTYQRDLSVLIESIRSENTDKDTTLDGLFCSEMVAHMLMKLGYLDKNFKGVDNYVPRNFSSVDYLPWLNGASLTKEKNVKKVSSCCILL
jgi:hypothetical protein